MSHARRTTNPMLNNLAWAIPMEHNRDKGRKILSYTLIAFVIALAAVSYSSLFILDNSLTKQSVTLLDQARYIRGSYALNDRSVPLIHPLYSTLVSLVHIGIGPESWISTARVVSILCSILSIVAVWMWVRQIDKIGRAHV